jgi:hypothetical protein
MMLSELELMAQRAELAAADEREARWRRDPELAWAARELPPWRSHWSFRDWLGRLGLPIRRERGDATSPATPALVDVVRPASAFGPGEDRAA